MRLTLCGDHLNLQAPDMSSSNKGHLVAPALAGIQAKEVVLKFVRGHQDLAPSFKHLRCLTCHSFQIVGVVPFEPLPNLINDVVLIRSTTTAGIIGDLHSNLCAKMCL